MIGGECIEVVSSFVYLGLKFNYNNKWKVAQKDLYDRASRAMFALFKKCKAKHLSHDLIADVFEKTITPILTYGCEIWGFENNDIVMKLQMRFYKLLLHLKPGTPSAMIFGELKKFPVTLDIKSRMLNFWFKLISSESQNKLTFHVYNCLHKLFLSGSHQNLYVQHIKKTLIEIGMHDLWLSHDVSNINFNWFKLHVKESLKNVYIQEWYSLIDNNSIFINYRMLKNEFCEEPYLTKIPSSCAISLLRFRVTNNYLPVNRLRYQNIPRYDRKCEKCNLNEIGDEFHYLFVCPFFSDTRKECMPTRFYVNPNTIKYRQLFVSSNRRILLKTKHFIDIINKSLKDS